MSTFWRLLWQPLWDGYAMRYWLSCKRDQVEGGSGLPSGTLSG